MRIDRRLLAGILACTPMAASSAGALDPTFGTAGKANVPGYSLAIQGDGKIVALGAATVTSGGFGPTVGGPVAMGYVETASSQPGTKINLVVRGNPLPAEIVTLPFIPNRFKR